MLEQYNHLLILCLFLNVISGFLFLRDKKFNEIIASGILSFFLLLSVIRDLQFSLSKLLFLLAKKKNIRQNGILIWAYPHHHHPPLIHEVAAYEMDGASWCPQLQSSCLHPALHPTGSQAQRSPVPGCWPQGTMSTARGCQSWGEQGAADTERQVQKAGIQGNSEICSGSVTGLIFWGRQEGLRGWGMLQEL